jgi:hypothetical protein
MILCRKVYTTDRGIRGVQYIGKDRLMFIESVG